MNNVPSRLNESRKRVFIAGVMQGSHTALQIHPQGYRRVLAGALCSRYADLDVLDPDLTDPRRLLYSASESAEMFFRYCALARQVDLLIAYVPEASMGTAVEMWEAYQAGVPIICISPMRHNWVIKLLTLQQYDSVEEFLEACNEGVLDVYLRPSAH